MIEVGDADRRAALLGKLGGFEESITLTLNNDIIRGIAEVDVDRTTAAGKASSVQFLRFPFSEGQVTAFRADESDVVLAIGHPEYRHMAGMSDEVRASLSKDFD